MAEANFSLGQVNITDYLHVIMRKVSNPIVEVQRQAFAPPQPTTRNISFTGLDATTYYADFRESADGIALGILLATYVFDVRTQQVIAEMRYYQVGGGRDIDPAANQDTITDAYLDGKNIFSVFKEGFRPLVPPTETFKEYDLVAGGGIKLLNGQQLSEGEVVVVWISYLTASSGGSGSSSSVFSGVKTITANTTLDSTYYNNRIKCEGVGTRLVITFPALSSIPDNTAFYFHSNKGSQFQTKFLMQDTEMFEFAGNDETELTMGSGEFITFIKSPTRMEVFQAHPNLQQVGQRFSGTWKDHINTMPEDARLLDGDDYPRPWKWIKSLPITHFIIDDLVTDVGYVHPVGKEGLFVVHSSLKKFRMPNTQGWSERGLKNFTNYATDTDRNYDYPGGTQPGQVGEFSLTVKGKKTKKSGVADNITVLRYPDTTVPEEDVNLGTINTSKETITKNNGVIYLRRI